MISIPVKAWIAAGVFVAGVAAGGFGVNVYKNGVIAGLERDYAVQVAEQQAEHARVSEEYRKHEKHLLDQIVAITEKANTERKGHEKTIADLKSKLSRLRNNPLTIPDRPAPGDTLAACRERAAALGKLLVESAGLLDEGADVSADLAIDAELLAVDLRAMIEYGKVVGSDH